MKPGAFLAKKKDGTIYYRSSITHQGKHISLGSYANENEAHAAYVRAGQILEDYSCSLDSYDGSLPFLKWVVLINFRDNDMYIKTPIYLYNKYFIYYFSLDDYYIFDIDDLFFYSTHSIIRRGGHLFVSDYGMQVNIFSRYGIKNYGVKGRDFNFVNGDSRDFRYENIEIINSYHGVFKKTWKHTEVYETRIHWNGEFIVGRYDSEIKAAVAYNKAASTMIKKGYDKKYPVNYLEELTQAEYKELFQTVKISKRIRELPENIKTNK